MQIIFRTLVSSLKSRSDLGNIIGEPIQVHRDRQGKDPAAARGQPSLPRTPGSVLRLPLSHEFSAVQAPAHRHLPARLALSRFSFIVMR